MVRPEDAWGIGSHRVCDREAWKEENSRLLPRVPEQCPPEVSWQKDDDLRVRRDETTVAAGETVERFLRVAERSSMVAAFLAERGADGLGRYRVYEADARRARRALPRLSEAVELHRRRTPRHFHISILIDSLVYLGLLSRDQHRRRDTLMGNREVTGGERAAYWADYETKRALLPKSTRDVVERIDRQDRSRGFSSPKSFGAASAIFPGHAWSDATNA